VAVVLVFVVLLIDAVPLWLFWTRISAHASKWRVQPVWYFRFAEFGWILGLLSMYVLVGMLLAFISKSTEVQGWMMFWAFLFGGLIGGTIAPAASYVALRMRTTPDPDYGPLDWSEE
jgi:hypothetical protein